MKMKLCAIHALLFCLHSLVNEVELGLQTDAITQQTFRSISGAAGGAGGGGGADAGVIRACVIQ